MRLLPSSSSLLSTLRPASVGLLAAVALSSVVGVFGTGCGSDDDPAPGGAAGTSGGTATQPDGKTDPGPRAFWITASGEDLALNGYPFTNGASKSADPAFVDGWAVDYEHVIVTIGGLSLAENPDKNAGDPKDLGAQVAHDDRAFAVDLHLAGSGNGGSTPIAAFDKKDDGSAFDGSTRYAFSYSLVAGTADAVVVNLDEEGKQLYQEAIERGFSTLVVGTATYKGPEPAADSAFAKLPKVVHFKLGLAIPARYTNCENPDFPAVGGELTRGVQLKDSASTQVQVTYHTDHMFWDTLNVEGTPLHFDPVAASANDAGEVTIDDLEKQDFLGFTLPDGTPLPARSVVADYTTNDGQLAFSGGGESFTKNSYAAFFRYSATAAGHLNADGECAVTDASGASLEHAHE
jgi:hypothetical protein